MASDLIDPQAPDRVEITADIQGRPLYLFTGYVAQRDQINNLSVMPPSELSIELFRPLYEYVRNRWHEKSYEIDRNPVAPSINVALPEQSTVESTLPLVAPLNLQIEQLALWPAQDGAALWDVAVRSSQHYSLCLGMANRRDALESPFLNVTTLDTQAPLIIARPNAPTSSHGRDRSVANEPESQRVDAKRSPVSAVVNRTLDHLFEPSPYKIVGGLTGGTVGFFLGAGPTPIGISFAVIGASVGWTTGALIEAGSAEWHTMQAESQSDSTQPNEPGATNLGYELRPRKTKRKSDDEGWFPAHQ